MSGRRWFDSTHIDQITAGSKIGLQLVYTQSQGRFDSGPADQVSEMRVRTPPKYRREPPIATFRGHGLGRLIGRTPGAYITNEASQHAYNRPELERCKAKLVKRR